jgi:Tfp pilus assembly protein PilV
VYALRQSTGAFRRPFAALRGRLRAARSEAGFALIEVLVSAALLSVVGIGVYNGIDGPAAISAKDRMKSQASSLAQQDQERMKSMKFDDLQRTAGTSPTVTLGQITFTTTSRTQWISDQTGTDSCTNSSASADYLVLISTVSWPEAGSTRSVTVRSLRAPPTGTGTNLRGNLSVQLTDEKTPALPVAGVPVSITGPGNYTVATNSEGCAVFAYIPVGSYQATYHQAGFVDQTANSNVTLPPTSVTGNNTTVQPATYAQAGSIAVSFKDSAGSPASWSSASLYANGIGVPFIMRSTPANTAVASLNSTATLFPFTAGYHAWAGDCPDPTMAPPTTGGYSSPAETVTVGPGGSQAVSVTLPTVNLQVKSGATALGNANVYITPVSACSDPGPTSYTPTKKSLKTLATPAASLGKLSVPLPYGDYTICADAVVGSSTRKRTLTVQDRGPTLTASGTPLQTFDVSGSGSASGACP